MRLAKAVEAAGGVGGLIERTEGTRGRAEDAGIVRITHIDESGIYGVRTGQPVPAGTPGYLLSGKGTPDGDADWSPCPDRRRAEAQERTRRSRIR